MQEIILMRRKKNQVVGYHDIQAKKEESVYSFLLGYKYTMKSKLTTCYVKRTRVTCTALLVSVKKKQLI